MADNILVQSGKRMHDQLATQPDLGGSFREGAKLVQGQIDSDLKRKQDAEDREYLTKKRSDEEFLREMDIDKKVTAYQAEKGAYFDMIQEGIDSGRLDSIDYAGFTENREAWWKDKANQLKFFADEPGLKESLENAELAEGNWPNILKFTDVVSISDSSPDAQKMDLAISAWGKENGATPPPIKTIDGKDYFVLPSADGQEEVKIPVKGAGKAQGPEDLYGSYNEKITMEGFQKDLMKALPGVDKLFRTGQATQNELAQVNQWFDKKIANNEQLIELADSFIQGLPDADFEAMGISDINNDGQVTGADLDLNGDGTIDGNELKGMRDLFKEVMTGFYDKEQLFQKNEESTFTREQVQTQNAVSTVVNGNINGLVDLPGVSSFTFNDKGTKVRLNIGTGKNAEVFDLDIANGSLTEGALDLLKRKFNWVSEDPIVDDGTPDNPIVNPEVKGESVVSNQTGVQTTQYSSENTGTIALNSQNFGNEPIPGLPKRFDYGGITNLLVGTAINLDNLEGIKTKLKSKGTLRSHEITIVMKHIEKLLKKKK